MEPIQMQLSQEKKSFSGFVAEFPKSILKFECFPKKDDSYSSYISEIRYSKTRGLINF